MADQTASTNSARKKSLGSKLTNLLVKSHAAIFRLTGGKIGGGKSVLLLTTIGRKSGKERHTPLTFFSEGDRFIIVASNGGASHHPAWLFNIQSNPQAKIQIGSCIISVHARQADSEERQHLWAFITEKNQDFITYQNRTTREIPIVILTPQA